MPQIDAEALGHPQPLFGSMNTSQNVPPFVSVDLLAFLATLNRRRKLAAVLIFGCAVLAVILGTITPRRYTATTKIMPPQQPQSLATAMLGQLAGGSGLASLAGDKLGAKTQTDLYIGMLKSRTIADSLIGRFHLLGVYRNKKLSGARKSLAAHSDIAAEQSGLIVISCSDTDPARAANLTNAYVDQLQQMTKQLGMTESSHRRFFFEEQLRKEKDALAEAEGNLKSTEQKTLLAPTGQAEALIRAGAQLQAEIASREVQLSAIRSYATEDNPQVEVLRREIETLQAELARMTQHGDSSSNLDVSAKRLPDASLDYARKLRDVKYHESLYELLSKQYESARLDEAREGTQIQVIDPAVVPDMPSSAPRRVYAAMGMLLGLAVLFAICIKDLIVNRLKTQKTLLPLDVSA